ncbi:fungal-specific transcription factor domain-containing protein [Mycena haematopus]|nr:fungal-specific transcription factor domain-containing protein [Mycena haematopus]
MSRPTPGRDHSGLPMPLSKQFLRACDICRHRKIRCDGPNMPNSRCTHCLTFGLVCTYIKPTKKRGPKNVAIEGLKREITSLKSKLHLCSACAKPLESPPRTDTSSNSPEPGTEPESTADDLGRRFTELSLKHYGSASGFRLLTTTIAIKAKHIGTSQLTYSRRPFFWDTLPWEKAAYARRTSYVYPAADLIASLLELYFTNFHPTLPILHRPSFERAVAARLYLTDMEFGGTLLAVLAVASRYSNDPRVYVDNAPLSAGWTFANQVQHLRPLSNPTINEVQIYFLLSLYTFGTSVPRMSWLYLGLGIRCLHERREFRRRKPPGDISDPAHELWKRAFWTYLMWDRLMSVFHGWPMGMQVEDYDVAPLLEVDDEYWDAGFLQPPGKPSQVSYLVCLVRLCEILGDAMRLLYGSDPAKSRADGDGDGADGEQRAVAGLDSAMNDFLDSVPPHLRWNHDCPPPHNTFFDQSALLHIAYNHVLIAIHRPYIHIQKAAPLAAPSLSICARAARAIIHTADVWLARRQRLPLAGMLNPVFIAGVVLVLCALATTRTGEREKNRSNLKDLDLGRVATAMDILKYAESRVQTVGRLWDLLHQLWSLGGPVPPLAAPQEGELGTSENENGVGVAPPTSPDIPPGSDFYNSPEPEPEPGYPPPPDDFLNLNHAFSLAVCEDGVVGPRAGMSVEELLADADPLDTMASILLDDEQRSMWMAAPMDVV